MDEYERVLLVKPDVQVYRIPPRATSRAYRASDWNLDAPDWTCRLRLISKGAECFIKLDEKSTGQFFGQCPIDKYPGPAVESVSDSSRYFVLKLVNEQSGRTAFVGIGFVDRSDSFDLNVALQDHFKIVQMESDPANKEAEGNSPKLDLGFKEGQTIKVNLNIGKKASSIAKARPKGSGAMGGILLPPPPGVSKTAQPMPSFDSKCSPPLDFDSPDLAATTATDHSTTPSFHQQLLDGLDSLSLVDGGGAKSVGPTKTGLPILTPANSVCIGDDFASFDPIASASTNVISANGGSSSSSKKTDDDLWSDFESFRSAEGSANASSNATNATLSLTATFDDWAKF